MRGVWGGVTPPPNNFNTRSQLQFDGDKSVPLWACMHRFLFITLLAESSSVGAVILFIALTYFLGRTDLISGY